jgi:hypothetical protein
MLSQLLDSLGVIMRCLPVELDSSMQFKFFFFLYLLVGTSQTVLKMSCGSIQSACYSAHPA